MATWPTWANLGQLGFFKALSLASGIAAALATRPLLRPHLDPLRAHVLARRDHPRLLVGLAAEDVRQSMVAGVVGPRKRHLRRVGLRHAVREVNFRPRVLL